MTRIALAAALTLLAMPAWAEDWDNVVTNPKTGAQCFGGAPEDCKFGPDVPHPLASPYAIFKPATKMPIAPGMTIAPVNDPYRDITIGQPGMTTIRCEHGTERIEITPTSEVRMFCKGVAP